MLLDFPYSNDELEEGRQASEGEFDAMDPKKEVWEIT